MEPEPAEVSRPSIQAVESSRSSDLGVKEGIDDEDPYSLSGTSISLFGLAMAIAVVGVPLVAVLTERPPGRESIDPTALQSDGSKSPLSFSLPGVGEPGR